MTKLGSYDNPDLVGVIDRVYVITLGDHLLNKHGVDAAPAIMEKFNNLERKHVIVEATIADTVVDDVFMIPGLTGWSKSNLKSFIQLNKLDSEVDTDVQKDLDKWVGQPVQGILQTAKDPTKGTFLRLAK